MPSENQIDLLTRDGERAATVLSLPWKIPPEGLQWGARTFFRQADGRYVEGLMFWIPPELYVDPTAEQAGMVEGDQLHAVVSSEGLKVIPGTVCTLCGGKSPEPIAFEDSSRKVQHDFSRTCERCKGTRVEPEEDASSHGLGAPEGGMPEFDDEIVDGSKEAPSNE